MTRWLFILTMRLVLVTSLTFLMQEAGEQKLAHAAWASYVMILAALSWVLGDWKAQDKR